MHHSRPRVRLKEKIRTDFLKEKFNQTESNEQNLKKKRQKGSITSSCRGDKKLYVTLKDDEKELEQPVSIHDSIHYVLRRTFNTEKDMSTHRTFTTSLTS